MDEIERSSEQTTPAYRYRDGKLNIIWQTSVPKDDEAALGYFHAVVRFGPHMKPVYCERIDQDTAGEHVTLLPEVFDPEAMETKPFGIDAL